jgi:hypothetical protein
VLELAISATTTTAKRLCGRSHRHRDYFPTSLMSWDDVGGLEELDDISGGVLH